MERARSEKLSMGAEEAETPAPMVSSWWWHSRLGGGRACLHGGSLGGQRKGWDKAASNRRVERVGGAAEKRSPSNITWTYCRSAYPGVRCGAMQECVCLSADQIRAFAVPSPQLLRCGTCDEGGEPSLSTCQDQQRPQPVCPLAELTHPPSSILSRAPPSARGPLTLELRSLPARQPASSRPGSPPAGRH